MFLPMNKQEMNARGWDSCDIIIVSGDAYVDHPSFGAAMIGRYLESLGYKVGVIAQPDCGGDGSDMLRLGAPKLFWGVTSGAMDSMVSNYTAQGRVRNDDAYSEKGEAFFLLNGNSVRKRPDRALMVYAQTIRRVDKQAFVVLGGVEASLRRFSHYDFIQEKIRHSVLIDTKADVLVYGMGEKAIAEIADRRASSRSIDDVRGICVLKKMADGAIELPPHELLSSDWSLLVKQFDVVQAHSIWSSAKIIAEKDGAWVVAQNLPQPPLNEKELDALYALPFERRPHPEYKRIPAFEMIQNSITAHRGCAGGCAFCSIGFHQGKLMRSRSEHSILREVEVLSESAGFNGHITDVGGPSADMYGARCDKPEEGCIRVSCLFPERCKYFKDDPDRYMSLLDSISRKVKKVSVGSGFRLDLLLSSDKRVLIVAERYMSGQMKIAPEHIDSSVLSYMGKYSQNTVKDFFSRWKRLSMRLKPLVKPYIIVGHPGETEETVAELRSFLRKEGVTVEAVQEFVPTPMTKATALYCAARQGKMPFLLITKGQLRKAKEIVVNVGTDRASPEKTYKGNDRKIKSTNKNDSYGKRK